LYTVKVEWTKDGGGSWKPEEMPGTEKYYPAELVFLALGFLGPQPEAIEALGVTQDARSNIKTPNKKYSTNVEGVFAAGDCRRGQSLIVWGIK
jgi:glutamate synthase (NADPH/NADH)